jgi:uncharacterized membrane protein
VLSVAVASPLASHLALAGGWDVAALPLAALQAVAAGVVLWGTLPTGRLRALAVVAPSLLLIALAAGAWRSPAAELLAAAGLSHAMLYAGLLTLFGASLSAGRTPLVTRLARRINPAFHAGMEGYTRAVTIAWCLFFAGQVMVSAALLALAPEAWRLFVTVLNLPLAVLMALAEYAVRRWRFRYESHTTLLATIRGVRPGTARRTSGPTSTLQP